VPSVLGGKKHVFYPSQMVPDTGELFLYTSGQISEWIPSLKLRKSKQTRTNISIASAQQKKKKVPRIH
jgi:hypothetical protein